MVRHQKMDQEGKVILPQHADRNKWGLLIDEYQARELLKGRDYVCLDRGNIVTVRLRNVVSLFRVA